MPTLVGMNSQTQTPSPASGATLPQQPSAYPRRVLLAVIGLSPQIVTETIYALALHITHEYSQLVSGGLREKPRQSICRTA